MSATIKKAYVSTPAGQIHYLERDGNGTPIIMLHQTASSAKMFEAMMAAYPAGRRLIALDTPGFGGSYEPDGEPTMAGYGEMLFAAIKALEYPRVHLFGHHTGASVAIEIAAAHPDAVASLSMIGPVVLTEEERGAFGSVYPKPFEPQDDGSHLMKMWDYVAELGATDLTLKHREFVDTAHAWA
ncbi:MAG: alpha/beta fold hydrolase, partial [Gammaproteobacteria bacterium]|nr:alpha/beta fold hydrolase [Gammaproteobacteria bacterium]